MDTALTMIRSPRAARRAPRLLAALALAAALVAIPATRPEDAAAMRVSERQVVHACIGLGGSIDYDFWSDDLFEVSCTLEDGYSFSCMGLVSGQYGEVSCENW
jgi:hypothetical protein